MSEGERPTKRLKETVKDELVSQDHAVKFDRRHHVVTLNTGASMPLIGLGTWKSDCGLVEKAVAYGIEHAGYRHVDCARVYENEKQVGHALRKVLEKGKVKREELFITSKLWNTCHQPARVRPALERTLQDLGLEYLDLYLIHYPIAFQYVSEDELFPKDPNGELLYTNDSFVETWKALEELVDEGLCKSIGLSNFNSRQISEVLKVARHKPSVLQIESHPFLTQEPLIEFCKENNIVVTAFSPLGSPDRPWAQDGDPSLLDHSVLMTIAKQHGKTPAQILIRFQIQRSVVVIPKSVSQDRMRENIHVFDFKLTEHDMKVLTSLNRDWRYCVPTKKNQNGESVFRDVASPFFPWHADDPF